MCDCRAKIQERINYLKGLEKKKPDKDRENTIRQLEFLLKDTLKEDLTK